MKLTHKINNYFLYTLHLLFPSRCFSCDQLLKVSDAYSLCSYCYKTLQKDIYLPRCSTCHSLLESDEDNSKCTQCSINSIIPPKNFFFSFYYKGIGKIWIERMKFNHYYDTISLFKDLLIANHSDLFNWATDYIIISPNSTKEICFGERVLKEVQKNIYKPISKPLLKNKNTLKQHYLSLSQRLDNMKNGFMPSPNIKLKSLKEHKYLVMDDIYTSGATLKNYIDTFKKNLNSERSHIKVLVFSRTPFIQQISPHEETKLQKKQRLKR